MNIKNIFIHLLDNMIRLAYSITTNPVNEVNSITLINRKIMRNDCYNKRIKYLKIPSHDTRLNSEGNKYKFVLSREFGGRCWKIIKYEGQYYIGGLNLVPFRLYRGKLNVFECVKFLYNHLNDCCFTSGVIKKLLINNE